MVELSGPSLFPNVLNAGGVRIWAVIALFFAILLFADALAAARLLRSRISKRRLLMYAGAPALVGCVALAVAGYIWMKTDQLLHTQADILARHYGLADPGFQAWQNQLYATVYTFRDWNGVLMLATIVILVVSARQVWQAL